MSARRNPNPSLLWQSHLFGRSGYATMAREILRELSKRPVDVAFRHFGNESEGDPETIDAAWYRRMSAAPVGANSCYVALTPASGQIGGSYFHEVRDMNPGHGRYVGYTMFESDRIPCSWRSSMESMDEIWVPATFNAETFSRSGVPREKIRVMPLGVDPSRFDPKSRTLFRLSTEKSFRFLSIFEWALRKGWDALLRAYVEEFRREDSVSLVVCAYRGGGVNTKENPLRLEQEIDRFLKESCGISRDQAPEILLLEEKIPDNRWADLFASTDAFVLPTRGEGWGVPYTEAAVTGLPIIATAWGAQLDYLNEENSYLIEVEGLSEIPYGQIRDNWLYAGHRWAEPSVASLRRHLRRVFECREEAKEKGRKAQETILSGFTVAHAAERIHARVAEICEQTRSMQTKPFAAAVDPPEKQGPVRLLWVGDDPEEEGLRMLLACFCASFEAPGSAELTVASASEQSAARIGETVESFRSLSRAPLIFVGVADEAKRKQLFAHADLFVYPSARLQESERTSEAIRQGVAVLANEESVPFAVKATRQGLFLSTKKIPKGKGAERRLIGRVHSSALAHLIQGATTRREELHRMGREAKETLLKAPVKDSVSVPLLATRPVPGVAAPFELRKVVVSDERGGWSEVMNAELRAGVSELMCLVEGEIVPGPEAIAAMKAEPQAALLYETTKDGAYCIARSKKARAYAALDSRFQSFEAMREWARAIRAAGGIVLGGSDHRLGAPFENDKDDGAIAFLELSNSLAAEDKKSESIAAARQALSWKAEYPDALLSLASALLDREEEGSGPEAKSLLRNALALRPADARIRHQLGRALVREKGLEEAFVHLNLASKIDPENSEIWNDLGVVLGSLGRLEEALGSLTHSRRIDEGNADAWINGADILEALGITDEARQWRRRAQSCAEAS